MINELVNLNWQKPGLKACITLGVETVTPYLKDQND